MRATVTETKKEKVELLYEEVLSGEKRQIRTAARIFRNFTSCFSAFTFGLSHYRFLERGQIRFLIEHKKVFHKFLFVSSFAKEHIRCWTNTTAISSNSITAHLIYTLTTDASLIGWSAFFEEKTAGDSFTASESLLHTLLPELKAVHNINKLSSLKTTSSDFDVKNIWT